MENYLEELSRVGRFLLKAVQGDQIARIRGFLLPLDWQAKDRVQRMRPR